MLGRIAIHLSDDKVCERRIEAGILLAKVHNAELVGIYAPGGIIGRTYEESIMPADVSKLLRSRYDEDRTTVQKTYTEKTAAAGIHADWRVPKGETDAALSLHSRYCDLIIMSKGDQSDGFSAFTPNLPESVMMAAGRPVLMIPNFGVIETIGQRVLYCWDQRREAARAFTDAAPLLAKSKELAVLEIDREEDALQPQDLRDDDFSRYCISRGYPEPKRLLKRSEGFGVGNVILNTATDLASDLIVMGAYGHSRMRQWVMGGASRTLLSSMTVPVLLSN